jgi:DNA (cytosine-5)-methyltransferase 1
MRRAKMRGTKKIRYIDLFCGIGGFRIAAEQTFSKHSINYDCVFSSDIDPYARLAYKSYFDDEPAGDISKIDASDIPDHDILFAGFPCQPFSIIGNGNGFQDTRGTLFFEIAKILKNKKPNAFLLENVKRLVGHDSGSTLNTILKVLKKLGYTVDFKILNALDFGLPQKRERVFIVGFLENILFNWPQGNGYFKPLSEILEKKVDKKYFASDKIRDSRRFRHKPKFNPSIWHENKSGNVSSYPYSCALRAGASYNYLLVNGIRRLTPREMLRLQGFPDDFKIVVSEAQTRKQAGNAVPVNVVSAILEQMIPCIVKHEKTSHIGAYSEN